MNKFSKEIQIGLVAIIGVVLLYFGLKFLKGLTVFSSDSNYYVKFDNITGLSASSPVYANGFRVGVVEDIIYNYDQQDQIVAVVGLNKEMRLPKGSTAVISSDLLGNIKLELVLGPNPVDLVAPGDTITGGLQKGVMGMAASMVPQIQAMLPKLDSILANVNMLLSDPALRNSLHHVDDITANLSKASNDLTAMTASLNKQMPSMLSKHSTRFIVSSTDERADSVLFKNTMEKLLESKMAIAVYKCTDPSGGYALTKDEGSFKLYFNDVGLFTSLVYPNTMDDAQDIYQRLVFDKLKTNLGMLFENVSAQILVSNGFEPYYYSWEEDDDGLSKKYEIDFLIYKGGKTIPFEVKSRNVSNKVSLERFREKFKKKIGEKYIVDILNLKHGDNLTYLPYYMLFCVK